MTIDVAFIKIEAPYHEQIVRKRCELLGDKDFYVDQEKLDVIVCAEDFDRPEFLEWVRKVMNHLEMGPVELVEGTAAMFAGTNQHAQIVGEASAIAEKYRNDSDGPE